MDQQLLRNHGGVTRATFWFAVGVLLAVVVWAVVA